MLRAVVVLTVLGALAWWRREDTSFATYALFWGVAAVSSVGWTAVRHRGDVVVLAPDALVVRNRDGEHRFAWDDVLEVSWSSGSWPALGGGPVLRTRGGPYDEPGPNSPAQVAQLALFGRRGTRRAARAVADVAAQHGVPFTPGLLDLVQRGKRSPRLPGERRDARGGSL
ncbi:hypothetical protein AB2L28_19135 [Kineococcus sp. TBRC 1896]|uniref:PH (Pleckstrin Homology) domain-containing protein n=1 Tax=Kineococcus mangrovi TaxID=1660183 RepID=A0ABV4I6P6_9ACTN